MLHRPALKSWVHILDFQLKYDSFEFGADAQIQVFHKVHVDMIVGRVHTNSCRNSKVKTELQQLKLLHDLLNDRQTSHSFVANRQQARRSNPT